MGGVDVDAVINSDNFGLQEMFVFFEIAFVIGLDLAPLFRVEILIQNVRVVKVPGSAADRRQDEERSRGN